MMSEAARSTGLDPRVADLPPSARLIYYALREADSALTRTEIIEDTALHPRTVRDELRELREAGVVESRPSPADPRRRLHQLRRDVEK